MGEHVQLTASDGVSLGAYRADPESPTRGAIVVIQEIFGVNGHIRDVVDAYAAAGYTAIAPALYDRVRPGVELGYEGDDMKAGMRLRSRVPLGSALADITAAADSVREAGRVGAVGFCWGGFLAAASAVELAGTIDAAVGYYGGGIVANLLDRSPRVPLLLHFGELDHAIPLGDVDKIRAAWPDVPVYVYAGAHHGFECDHRASFDAQSTRLGFARTLRFFSEQIG